VRRRDFARAAAAALPLAPAAARADREPPSPRVPDGPGPAVATLEHLEASAVEWTDEHGYGCGMVADRAYR
jgi:hypothetical protein